MKAGIYRRRDNGKLIYVAKDRTIRAFQLTDFHPCENTVTVRTREKEQVVEFTPAPGAGLVFADRWADVPNGCTDPVNALFKAHAANDREIKRALGLPDATTVEGEGVDFKTAGVSPEWADGRYEKKFSQRTVTGYGPGFLAQSAAQAEAALMKDIAGLKALEAQGVIEHVVDDEWRVVKPDEYMAYLEKNRSDVYAEAAKRTHVIDTERFVGRPAALGMPYGEAAQYQAMRNLGYRRCHKQSARKHRQQGHTVIPAGDGAYWWIATKAA